MSEKFEHSQFAHCESGAISTLLTHYGLKISEPMAFGITSSLSFVFLPIIKLNNMPLIAYRAVPKNIINKVAKIFGIEMIKKTYKNGLEANNDLTRFVEENRLVGLQTSVFYLPYFPKDMRFHFNAHNLIVYGKEGNKYKVSDPVFEETVLCDEKELTKARFAKGVFAPKGFMYYPKNIPNNVNFSPIIKKAIKKNSKSMLTPFPYAGVKGMRTLAKKISKLNPNSDPRYLKNYLTHIVRMQEEIGTGGGGFRFLYAAFLKESKQYNLDTALLDDAASLLVKSGNTLREFALLCVESSKKIDKFDANKIAEKLVEASKYEEEAFKLLKKI